MLKKVSRNDARKVRHERVTEKYLVQVNAQDFVYFVQI